MYFKCEGSGWNINIVVEMMDWLTPDWSNAQYVTANNYYTIEDWRTGENRGVSYESSECNEGPHVIYHEDKNGKGLYYFTYSMNDYATSAYQVGMAVSDSPMGPFRKLTEAEGGLLLCARTARSKSVSASASAFGCSLFVKVYGLGSGTTRLRLLQPTSKVEHANAARQRIDVSIFVIFFMFPLLMLFLKCGSRRSRRGPVLRARLP